MKILRISFVILCIILVLCMSGCADKQQELTVDELISLGERFLLELNYEQALIQFNKVIEIEPMNVRGYTGAAEAYIGLEQLDEAVAILQKGLEQTEDDEIQNMLDVLKLNDIGNSNEKIDELTKNTQNFTPDEIATMKEVCEGIIRDDYEFLFAFLSKPEFAELFTLDTGERHSFTWLSEHGEVEFSRGYHEEGYESDGKARGTYEIYTVSFGDIENGVAYHLYWGETYGTDMGVTVNIHTITHRKGLSNGEYSVYRYSPNSVYHFLRGEGEDVILVHTTGMAVNGVKSGVENGVQTYKDGTIHSFELQYDGDTEDGSNFIGRYYNEDTGEYDFMNN